MSSRAFCILFMMFMTAGCAVDLLTPKNANPKSIVVGTLVALGFGCFFAAIIVGMLEG